MLILAYYSLNKLLADFKKNIIAQVLTITETTFFYTNLSQ